MDQCPITCPCRRSPAGGFILALCAWAALWSSTLLGENFGAMLGDLVAPPHELAPALILWTIALGVGLWLTVSGVGPSVREDDDAQAWLFSLAAIGGGTAALALGWTPEGSFLSLATQGLYVAVISAGATNVGLSLAARGYRAGYVAGALGAPGGAPARFDPARWQRQFTRQSTEIAELTAERDRLANELAYAGPTTRELKEILRDPNVRRAVLKTYHRDSHPGISENAARALDERFKKANAVFERLGNAA